MRKGKTGVTDKIIVCKHGTDQDIKIDTKIEDKVVITTFTQAVCKECLKEIVAVFGTEAEHT